MNITRLFTRNRSVETVTHVASSTARISRTFEDLFQNVARLCAQLQRLGIRPGDYILILCASRIEAVESILAAFNLGAVAMPLSPLLGSANLLAVIRDMRPKCCIFEEAPEADVLQELEAHRALMIAMKAADARRSDAWLSYDSLAHHPGPATLHCPDYVDEQPALVIHGSGSSGTLKAVVMSHGALLRFFEYYAFLYSQYSEEPDSLTGTSALLSSLPLSHVAGLATCLYGLMSGRRIYLLRYFVPESYLKLVEEARCSFMLLVPSLYRRLLSEPYLREMDRSALRFCISGGEHCPPELIDRIEAEVGVPLVGAYSMTECLSGIGHTRRDLFGRRIKRGSCGKQLFGELKLCDPQGQEHPDSGELWVRNSTVYECYRQAEHNASRIRGGWFRTGDLFHRDAEGDFFHRGRADDMFICNGKNIYPIEIELLLAKHPAVDAACAAPIVSPVSGIVPAVLVVPRQPTSATELQEFFARVGPSHAIPQVVKLVDSMPLLGPAKIDRRRATQMLQEAHDNAGG